MRRIFWTALGASVGVLVVRKVTRTAESYTPEGVARGLAGMGDGLREMAAVVREAMDQRDAELRLALGIDEGSIDAEAARALIDAPASDHPPTSVPGGRARQG